MSDESVSLLGDMGFSVGASTLALAQCNGSFDTALELLLSGAVQEPPPLNNDDDGDDEDIGSFVVALASSPDKSPARSPSPSPAFSRELDDDTGKDLGVDLGGLDDVDKRAIISLLQDDSGSGMGKEKEGKRNGVRKTKRRKLNFESLDDDLDQVPATEGATTKTHGSQLPPRPPSRSTTELEPKITAFSLPAFTDCGVCDFDDDDFSQLTQSQPQPAGGDGGTGEDCSREPGTSGGTTKKGKYKRKEKEKEKDKQAAAADRMRKKGEKARMAIERKVDRMQTKKLGDAEADKEITVLLDKGLADSSIGVSIVTALASLDVPITHDIAVRPVSLYGDGDCIDGLIQWRRVKRQFAAPDDDAILSQISLSQAVEPVESKPEITAIDHILLIVSPDVFVKHWIGRNEGRAKMFETIEGIIGPVKSRFDGYRLTLVVDSWQRHLHFLRSEQSRAVRQNLRSTLDALGSPGDNEGRQAYAMRGVEARLKEYADLAFAYLQLQCWVNVVFSDDGGDTSRYVAELTQSLARAPYKKESIVFQSGRRKGTNAEEVFQNQLCQVPGISVEKAKAICRVYPTLQRLIEAYMKCRDPAGMLKDIQANTPAKNSRPFGPALSKRLYKFFVGGACGHDLFRDL